MNTIVSKLEGLNGPPKLKFNYPQNTYNIIIAQQSLPRLNHQYFFPIVDVSKRFEQSLEKCRKRHQKQKMKIKAIEKLTISRQMSDNIENYCRTQNCGNYLRARCTSESIETNEMIGLRNNRRASELVDQLLLDIYGRGSFATGSSERIFDTEYGSSTSFKSFHDKFEEKLHYNRLILKDITELRILIDTLSERVTYAGNLLVKQLKKRDALKSKQEKICNVITAHLHAYSDKKSEDTNMRFSPNPTPGDSGFNQWRDAMKMVAKLPGGIPPEFRRKLWIALAEKHLQSKGVNWGQTEKLCFNEWSNPDDSELGIQIVKDLHRTGCSLFCGAAGQENQVLLKRVLLAYARWNKSVGYCQGFNMLAALILQVMDKNETDSVKVMIYLIEGVLPESYFANNLRGLSVDMIVFRDLLKMRLPQLSRHLEALQNDVREGNSYEPPLTNVFTMQWFLTLFCNCLPQTTVLRVWDLIFLEGNEILLRTAIAIWEKLSDRILAVNSADEFYSIMGVLTREMLEFGLVDSNTLVKSIVAIGACSELNEMRDRYLYNITPWTQSVQTAAKKGFKLFYSDDDDVESDYDEKAAVTAAYGISIGRKRDKQHSNIKEGTVIQPYAHGHPDRERLALDISALKKQYAKLRERQRQAHIILQAACARQPMGQNSTTAPIAMNHLLLGKNAIINSRGRRLGPPKGSIPPARTKEPVKKTEPVASGETIQWKDTAKFRRRQSCQSCTEEPEASQDTLPPESDSSSYSGDDASSTSTELCDEPGRMSDFDSDDKFSDVLESKKTVKELKNNLISEKLVVGPSDVTAEVTSTKNLGDFGCSEVVDMHSEFREILSDIQELKNDSTELVDLKIGDKIKISNFSEFDSKECKKDEPTNIIAAMTTELEENKSKIDIEVSSNKIQPTTDETLANFEELTSSDIGNNEEQITTDKYEFSSLISSLKDNFTAEEVIQTANEDTFELFLQERVKILKDNSSDSLCSPKEETSSRRSSDDKLRRHRSYEETSNNHLDKCVIFKQKSFDIGVLPIIETSLWKPYQIEEESPRDEFEDKLHQDDLKPDRPKEIKKQTSIDLLTVEDKRLESGRRNSERALKIIQENSLILHRILQQQKSSEKEDSEDELSRSPISKTFLRSESLLSKDEKTDEERSSKDGDDELESGVESFSVSPALLDEESDRSLKKDHFDDQDETLIISKNEDTEYSYKYQSSDNTSNIISSSIFEDSSITKNEETNISKNLLMDTSPIASTFSHTTFEDYSPNVYEETAKFDVASNISDYSKDNEEHSSSYVSSNNKYVNTEENSATTFEDSEEISPYRFSFKYKEDSEDNIKTTAIPNEEDIKHEELLSFLSDSNVASNSSKIEERSPETNNYLSYLNQPDDKWILDTSSSKEEIKSYLQDTKEDMLSFKISDDDYTSKKDTYNNKSFEKEDLSSFAYSKSPENSSPYQYRFREDSNDNIKDKYTSYLQNEDPVSSSSKYRASSPADNTDILSSPKFYYKFGLDSPEYSTVKEDAEAPFSSKLNSATSTVVNTGDHVVKPIINDSFDNNKFEYNRELLSIDLPASKYSDVSPEISPPSCLQFTSFQTDLPCTSKSIQFSPICSKEKPDLTDISPTKTSPKYFSTFKLPTLSPPRRAVKSPISPNKTFSPFPVQPTMRQPKELGIKLGLYKDLSPLKSPTK